MHASLLKKELKSYGLNPSHWLIQKISLQKDGTFVLFESVKNQGLKLKGRIDRRSSMKLKSLELCGI